MNEYTQLLLHKSRVAEMIHERQQIELVKRPRLVRFRLNLAIIRRQAAPKTAERPTYEPKNPSNARGDCRDGRVTI